MSCWCYPLKNCYRFNHSLAAAIDNYQKLFGINVEVYRVDKRETDNVVLAYGGFHAVRGDHSSKIFDCMLICTPTELHDAYSVASGNSELDVYTTNKDMLIGDIIKYEWVDGTICEFEVMTSPKTVGESYFQYHIKSMYQVNSK